MSAAPSRLRRRLTRTIVVSRSERMAKLLAHYDFASFRPPPRIVPDEEIAYALIDPMAWTVPLEIRGGMVVNRDELAHLRRRAYAARVWLARRLARMAVHAGLAAAWRGNAREDLYKFRLYSRAVRQARAEFGR